MNEVALRWARLVLGWVTVFRRVPYTTSVCNQPTRSTQPCIPPGLLNRVPALISWGKGRIVTSAGWQVTLCDPIWHVSSRSGEASSRTAISGYFTLLYLRKCVCRLRIVYAYLASGGPWTPLGTSVPRTTYAHPTSKPWLRHWTQPLPVAVLQPR